MVNSVGAGDSLVAGFLANYQQSNDILEAFRYGVAAGSASAFSADLCTLAKITKLLPQVIINKLAADMIYPTQFTTSK